MVPDGLVHAVFAVPSILSRHFVDESFFRRYNPRHWEAFRLPRDSRGAITNELADAGPFHRDPGLQ